MQDGSSTQVKFLEKLKIENWSYVDCIVSAILFSIQYELTHGSPSFFILSKNIVYLLFDGTAFGKEVFEVLKITNLFSL